MTITDKIAPEHDGLPDINEVAPLSEQDKQCFIELREVLKRHNALKRFGVTLLHNHFPIHEGEVLVEECDEERRILTLKPVKRSGLEEKNLLETNWRLDSEASTLKCQGYCIMSGGSHVGPGHRTIND